MYNNPFKPYFTEIKNIVEEKNRMKRLLVKALKNRFEMAKEDAIALAKTVEEIFNGEEEIEDMTIDKYARALFYELQKEKLLKLRREEYKKKGKIIRKYYWSFNNEVIREVAYEQNREDPYRIYKKIPKEAWVAHLEYN
ncbi:MAG: hypothetical protein DRM98_04500 [Thermoplasmata archaeon]|nr:MAG: hypothetical protein DRM98_04500 [Thermoplasmata archaeon]RLF35289.1 MAG: hypothetical protein DRM99_04965 [Thermoplasmata archaeon]